MAVSNVCHLKWHHKLHSISSLVKLSVLWEKKKTLSPRYDIKKKEEEHYSNHKSSICMSATPIATGRERLSQKTNSDLDAASAQSKHRVTSRELSLTQKSHVPCPDTTGWDPGVNRWIAGHRTQGLPLVKSVAGGSGQDNVPPPLTPGICVYWPFCFLERVPD